MTGWLSMRNAAKYCDVSYRLFKDLVSRGQLRADGMVGTRRRFSPANLDRWMRFQADDAARDRRSA